MACFGFAKVGKAGFHVMLKYFEIKKTLSVLVCFVILYVWFFENCAEFGAGKTFSPACKR